LPLSERVRIEIFIPDFPDPAYGNIVEQLGNELTYAFGGCTIIQPTGKYRSSDGLILPDKIQLLFSDTAFSWMHDRLLLDLYAERIQIVVKRALSQEESVLVVVYPVYHAN
jgi:hypothetical protein